MSNLSGPHRTSTTGFRNVYRVQNGWLVQIQRNYKFHRFGPFLTIKKAVEVAAAKRRELFGEFSGKG